MDNKTDVKITMISGRTFTLDFPSDALAELVKFIGMGHGAYTLTFPDRKQMILNIQNIETLEY